MSEWAEETSIRGLERHPLEVRPLGPYPSDRLYAVIHLETLTRMTRTKPHNAFFCSTKLTQRLYVSAICERNMSFDSAPPAFKPCHFRKCHFRIWFVG